MTTSMLQQLVYLRHERPGRRAVVVGAEHVSFSALLTLSHGGARAVAMIDRAPPAPDAGGLSGPAPRSASGRRFTPARAVSAIRGRPPGRGGRAHRSRHRRDARGRVRPGRLHRGLDPRPRARGPGRDRARPADEGARRRCRACAPRAPGSSRPATFSTEPRRPTSRALDGRHVAAAVARHLDGEEWPTARVPDPLRARRSAGSRRTPSTLAEGTDGVPPRGRFLLRAAERLDRPRVEIVTGRAAAVGRPPAIGWTPDARCGSPPRGQRRSSQNRRRRSLRGSAPR